MTRSVPGDDGVQVTTEQSGQSVGTLGERLVVEARARSMWRSMKMEGSGVVAAGGDANCALLLANSVLTGKRYMACDHVDDLCDRI